MAKDGPGLHHFHKRKRIHLKHEKYPHPNKGIRFLDKLIFVVGVLGPLMTIPQVIKIWVEHNAAGVSFLTWSSFLIFDSVWLTYGIVHKEKPIIVSYSVWLVLELIIVIGIIRYNLGLF